MMARRIAVGALVIGGFVVAAVACSADGVDEAIWIYNAAYDAGSTGQLKVNVRLDRFE
jgi:hypothetical protein